MGCMSRQVTRIVRIEHALAWIGLWRRREDVFRNRHRLVLPVQDTDQLAGRRIGQVLIRIEQLGDLERIDVDVERMIDRPGTVRASVVFLIVHSSAVLELHADASAEIVRRTGCR